VGLLNGLLVSAWRNPAVHRHAGDDERGARGWRGYLSGGAAISDWRSAKAARRHRSKALAGSDPAVRGQAARPCSSCSRWPVIHVMLSYLPFGRLRLCDRRQRGGGAPVAGCGSAANKALVYVVCGVLAALAGLGHCAQLEAGQIRNDGVAYELDAIAAVVIGGTSLAGGVGTASGTLVGTLINRRDQQQHGVEQTSMRTCSSFLKGRRIILGAVWLQRRPPLNLVSRRHAIAMPWRGGDWLGVRTAQRGRDSGLGSRQCNLGEPWRVAMKNAEGSGPGQGLSARWRIVFADAQTGTTPGRWRPWRRFLRQRHQPDDDLAHEAKPLRTADVRKAYEAGIP
jgi:hypothetical protein